MQPMTKKLGSQDHILALGPSHILLTSIPLSWPSENISESVQSLVGGNVKMGLAGPFRSFGEEGRERVTDPMEIQFEV